MIVEKFVMAPELTQAQYDEYDATLMAMAEHIDAGGSLTPDQRAEFDYKFARLEMQWDMDHA